MKKRMTIMLICVGVLLLLIFGWWGFKKAMIANYIKTMKAPPATISAVIAKNESWQPRLTAIGTLHAVNGVNISTQVSGIVTQIHFKSGSFANKGDLLIQLDTSVEDADLKNYAAQLMLAKIDYQRNSKLFQNHSVAKSNLDASLAALQQAEANLQRTQALINQKNIVAPFSGKLGIKQINVGTYVNAGDLIVSLQDLDTLHVDFSFPEESLAHVYVDQEIELKSSLSNAVYKGKVNAVNSITDEKTRSIQVEATIANTAHQLLPGMSSTVHALLPKKDAIVTLPQTALTYSLYGDSVFVIYQSGKDEKGKPILKVKRTAVKVGERQEDRVQILSGVKPGEQVVSAGQLKLNDGSEVIVNNSVVLK